MLDLVGDGSICCRYLAPEYFMYGKVNDKIDVYAFGVVLLELLSGRKPISSEYPKGQESLVMWVSIPYIAATDLRFLSYSREICVGAWELMG